MKLNNSSLSFRKNLKLLMIVAILLNSLIIEINTNITKEKTKKLKFMRSHKSQNLFFKNKSNSASKSKRNKRSSSNPTDIVKKAASNKIFSSDQIKERLKKLQKKRRDEASEHVLGLKKNVKKGCIRVFDEIDFKSEKYYDLCSNQEVKDMKSTYKKIESLIIPEDMKVLVALTTKRRTAKRIDRELLQPGLHGNSLGSNQFTLIKPGEVAISSEFNFSSPPELISQSEINTKNYTIKSIALGAFTSLKVIMQDQKEVEIFRDTYEISFENYSSIEIVKSEPISTSNVAPNCILLIKDFELAPNQEPDSFCDDSVDTNSVSFLTTNASESSEKVDSSSKSQTDNGEPDNFLDKISTQYQVLIKSIVVGEKVSAVLFDGPYLTGNAYLVESQLLSTGTPDHKDITNKIKIFEYNSIYILKPGCLILFEEKDYKITGKTDESKQNLKICYSIDSIPLAFMDLTNFGSIILAKDTIIDIYPEPNYKGEPKRLFSSTTNYIKSVGSIKILTPQVREIKLIMPSLVIDGVYRKDTDADEAYRKNFEDNYNNFGCVLAFEKENYKGNSRLYCDEKHADVEFSRNFRFRSALITKNDKMILSYAYKNGLIGGNNDLYSDSPLRKIKTGLLSTSDPRFISFNTIKPGCVMLFDKKDFKGSVINVCENISDLSSESNGLTNYHSIIVGADTSVTLHTNINFVAGSSSITTKKSINKLDEGLANLHSVEFDIANNPQKSTFFIDTGFSVLNLFTGIFLGLFSEDFNGKGRSSDRDLMLSCIPKRFISEDTHEDESSIENSVVEFKEGHDGFFSKFLSAAKDIMRKLIKWYCNFKDKAIGYIELLTKVLTKLPDSEETIAKKAEEKAKKEKKGEKNSPTLDALSWFSDNIQSSHGSFLIKFANEGLNELEEKKKAAIEAGKIKIPVLTWDQINTSTADGKTPKPKLKIKKKVVKNDNKEKATRLNRKFQTKNKKTRIAPTKRKFRVAYKTHSKGIWSSITNFYKKAKDKALRFYRDTLMKVFLKIKDKINVFITKITNFFKHKWVLYIIKTIGCVLFALGTLKDKIMGFYKNIEVIILGVTTIEEYGLGAVIILDFLLSLLCNIKYFKLAFSYFKLGNSKFSKNRPMAFSYYGLAIGTILNCFATATPFTTSIVELIDPVENAVDLIG